METHNMNNGSCANFVTDVVPTITQLRVILAETKDGVSQLPLDDRNFRLPPYRTSPSSLTHLRLISLATEVQEQKCRQIFTISIMSINGLRNIIFLSSSGVQGSLV